MHLLIGCLVIFLARTLDVSLGTLRILMILHGQRLYAAIIGFFESLIFITALTYVVREMTGFPTLVFYALGYAAGIYLGIFIEEKVAIGFVTIQVISKKEPSRLINEIRQKGYGVTVIEGSGREGSRKILHVLLKRKDVKTLIDLVEKVDDHAFITILDTKKIMGGYFSKVKVK